MNQNLPLMDGPLWPYVALFLCAVLTSEIWRWLAVFFARRFDEDSPGLEFVRMFAMALMAAVVAKLVITPGGALGAMPLWLRLTALGAPILLLTFRRRYMFPAVLLGESILIGGGWWITGG